MAEIEVLALVEILGWHRQTLSSSKHDLVVVKKSSLLLCTFLLSSNTYECILIFVGYSISCECPVSEDFHNYISQGVLCPKAL